MSGEYTENREELCAVTTQQNREELWAVTTQKIGKSYERWLHKK
jgi:hypothetical protein